MVGTKARWYRPPVKSRARVPRYQDGVNVPFDRPSRDPRKAQPRLPKGTPRRAVPAPKVRPEPDRRRDWRMPKTAEPLPDAAPRPVSPMPEAPARPYRTVRPSRITLGRLYAGLAVVDAVDQLVYPMPGLPPALPSNWYWCRGPGPMPLVNWYNAPYFRSTGSCAQPVPLLGQGPGPGVGTPLPNAANRERYWSHRSRCGS